jgi:hypothetical protein
MGSGAFTQAIASVKAQLCAQRFCEVFFYLIHLLLRIQFLPARLNEVPLRRAFHSGVRRN